MRMFTLSTIAAAAMALTAVQARAEIVKLDGFTHGSGIALNVSAPSYSGPSGQFSGTLNGNPFLTYCTDLLQSFYFGNTYSNYSVVSGVTAFGAAKSQLLDQAMSTLITNGQPTDPATSAIAQAIVWEVLYESGSGLDLASGSFQATSAHALTQAGMNAVDWSTMGSTPATYHVDQLFSPTAQDFLVVSAAVVPEPASMALVATALFGMGAARRRSRKAAAG